MKLTTTRKVILHQPISVRLYGGNVTLGFPVNENNSYYVGLVILTIKLATSRMSTTVIYT